MKKKSYIAYRSNINLEQTVNRYPNSKIVKLAISDYKPQFQNAETIVSMPNSQVAVSLW